MIFITQESELDINHNKFIVLYFYASWIPFHKKMLIMLDKMEQKYSNAVFYAIDADFFKSFCKRFDVSSIPSTLILNNGKVMKNIVGLTLTSVFKRAFGEILRS